MNRTMKQSMIQYEEAMLRQYGRLQEGQIIYLEGYLSMKHIFQLKNLVKFRLITKIKPSKSLAPALIHPS